MESAPGTNHHDELRAKLAERVRQRAATNHPYARNSSALQRHAEQQKEQAKRQQQLLNKQRLAAKRAAAQQQQQQAQQAALEEQVAQQQAQLAAPAAPIVGAPSIMNRPTMLPPPTPITYGDPLNEDPLLSLLLGDPVPEHQMDQLRSSGRFQAILGSIEDSPLPKLPDLASPSNGPMLSNTPFGSAKVATPGPWAGPLSEFLTVAQDPQQYATARGSGRLAELLDMIQDEAVWVDDALSFSPPSNNSSNNPGSAQDTQMMENLPSQAEAWAAWQAAAPMQGDR